MNIDDFITSFGQICVCKYNKNYINSSIPLHFSDENNGFKGVYLGVTNQTEGYLTIIQKDHRNFPKGTY